MPDSPDLRELLDFYQLGPDELEALQALRPLFESQADDFLDSFYRHLISFSTTQNLLRDETVKARLLDRQREYLLGLCDPRIDPVYIDQRRAIGDTHERVGLDTRWYLGAYALYASLLLPSVLDELRHDPVASEKAVTALVKRLIFDAHLAVSRYMAIREEDLARLNQELRSVGLALSREVREQGRSLRQTEARARAAEQLASVATLVTGLAHEVGTPMGVIRGHAEALEDSVESERGRWRLSMILEQIDRITSIIQSLLNIARPKESLRIELDLPELVETTLGFLSEKIRRRNVEVKRECGDLPELVGDPEKMQQLLLNLFINALDAMPEGGVLSVSVLAEGDEVLLRVCDTGTGIPSERLEHIFDPFYTTKPAGRGNGLGLVVVKGIVGEHGGRIEARSEPGDGTEFLVRLPSGRTQAASGAGI
jgi:signal transduction histidine kinase